MKTATFIAGGTTLVDLMKLGVETPDALIDLISEGDLSSEVTQTSSGLRIGALATMAKVASHPDVPSKFPAIQQSLLQAASPQIRNMATVGGNLLQKTRCPMFRDTSTDCAKRDPEQGCAALGGPQRGMAILGRGSSCVAAYPGDLAVALVAHEASVTIRAEDGTERILQIENLHRLPGNTPHLEHTLLPGERIVWIDVPQGDWTHTSYTKLRDRAAYAFALASVALCIKMDDAGHYEAARLAIGGLAAKPWRCHKAEEALLGNPYSDDLAEAVATACFADAEGDAGMIAVGKSAVRASLSRANRDQSINT